MAFFEFIGTSGDDRDGIVAFGHTFRSGEVVEVTDQDAIAKLTGNGHFRKHDGRTRKAKRGKSGSDEG